MLRVEAEIKPCSKLPDPPPPPDPPKTKPSLAYFSPVVPPPAFAATPPAPGVGMKIGAGVLLVFIVAVVVWSSRNSSPPVVQPPLHEFIQAVLLQDTAANVSWIRDSSLVRSYGDQTYEVFRRHPEIVGLITKIHPAFEPTNLDVSSGVYAARLSDGRDILLMSGCRQHACSVYHASIAVDPRTLEVFLYERGGESQNAYFGRDDTIVRDLLAYADENSERIHAILSGATLIPQAQQRQLLPNEEPGLTLLEPVLLGRWKQVSSADDVSELEFLTNGVFKQRGDTGGGTGRWSFIDASHLKIDGYSCPCAIRFDDEVLVLSFESGTEVRFQ